MSQVTVTGKAGPAIAVTTQVLTNVSYFGIDTNNEVLTVQQGGGAPILIDITAATTITVTVSGNNYTVSIS